MFDSRWLSLPWHAKSFIFCTFTYSVQTAISHVEVAWATLWYWDWCSVCAPWMCLRRRAHQCEYRESERTTECLWSTGTLELIHRLFLAVKVPNPSSLYLATFVFPPFLYFVPFLRLIMTIEQIQTLKQDVPLPSSSSFLLWQFMELILALYIHIYLVLCCLDCSHTFLEPLYQQIPIGWL